ncbi:hypothetical protein YC2023_051162 [Brassica napus]
MKKPIMLFPIGDSGTWNSSDHDSDNPIRHTAISATGSVVVSVNEEGDATIWNDTLELSTSIEDNQYAAQITTTAANTSTTKKRGKPKKVAADAEYERKEALVQKKIKEAADKLEISRKSLEEVQKLIEERLMILSNCVIVKTRVHQGILHLHLLR